MSPLPAISPATNVPWPSVSTNRSSSTQTRGPGPARRAQTAARREPRMRRVYPRIGHHHRHVRAAQTQVICSVSVSTATPVLTRLKSFAWTRRMKRLHDLHAGQRRQPRPVRRRPPRTTGPNGDTSRDRIRPPSFQSAASSAARCRRTSPRFNTAPAGSGSVYRRLRAATTGFCNTAHKASPPAPAAARQRVRAARRIRTRYALFGM